MQEIKRRRASPGPGNRELITANGHIRNKYEKMICYRFSIGMVIADLCGFKSGDRLHLLLSEDEDRLLLIKNYQPTGGRKLYKTPQSHSLKFDLVLGVDHRYKLHESIKMTGDFYEDELLIDISKLRKER